MKFIADLHLHSKYSRATAKNLDLENLYYSARIKGVTVVGTGDFTHPAWISDIKTKLEPAEPGLFRLKKDLAKKMDAGIPNVCQGTVRFILQSEISSIYKKNDRVRKNHNLVYFPDIDSVERFNTTLDAIGNIKSDGRPILGLDALKLLEIMLDINDHGMFVPAHIWTPWFSMFGSKSGFDAMEDCFEDLTDQIFAVETGLSSDPPMNWRVKDLDKVRLISSSDAHSPGFLGRNASVFNTGLSYTAIRDALKNNDPKAYQGTLDMYPHQGKYHFDGHRKCGICLNPATTQQVDGICPECGKPLTLGVLYRVQELASRPEGYQPNDRHGYQHIIPLTDILSEIFSVGPKTKKVTGFYNRAIEALGPELKILTELSIDQIDSANVPLLGQAIAKMRKGDINIDPGFDGEYGVVKIFSEQEKGDLKGEASLLLSPKARKARKTRKKNQIKTKPISPAPRAKKKVEKVTEIGLGGEDLIGTLNPEQRAAVESTAKATVVQAGPGTGKTRTLTAKIAWLITEKKTAPQQILALTFTNKSARELSQRIESYLPGDQGSVMASTFHAFCLYLLKTYQKGFSAHLVDNETRLYLIREAFPQKPGQAEIRKADQFVSACKQNLLPPDGDLDKISGGDGRVDFKSVYRNYQTLCRLNQVIDFEDLIFDTISLLKNDNRIYQDICAAYPHIFIDEYQDLNYGQYVLAKLLAASGQIFVIGDPDQSIYGFRGSDNRYFKLFEIDFPGCKKIVLTRNYRSTRTILDASFQVMSRASDHDRSGRVFSDIDKTRQLIIKETTTENSEAVAIGKMIEKLVGGTSFFSMDAGRVGMDDQKEYSFSDFAILYRTSRQAKVFENVFSREGIPFQSADTKKIFDSDGIQQLISICRVLIGRCTPWDIKIVLEHLKIRQPDKILSFIKAVDTQTKTGLEHLEALIAGSRTDGLKPSGKKQLALLVDRLTGLRDRIDKIMVDGNVIEGVKLIKKEMNLEPRIEASEDSCTAFEKIIGQARLSKDLSSLIDAIILGQDPDALASGVEKVSLMTMHASKGLEFPVVFLSGCEQGLIPFARDGVNAENLEEERRLFYVGMTRAMDILCLTYAKKRRIYGTQKNRQRSFFIEDIEKKLLQMENAPASRKGLMKKEKQLELF